MTQIDLFSDAAQIRPAMPSAIVMPFPLSRRRKLVMRTAKTLTARKTREGRDSYWSRLIQDLAAGLRHHGADQATIDRHLTEFHRAVSDELAAGHHQQPPGAA